MNITREQYEADIRAAKAEGWDEAAEESRAFAEKYATRTCDLYATNPYRTEL